MSYYLTYQDFGNHHVTLFHISAHSFVKSVRESYPIKWRHGRGQNLPLTEEILNMFLSLCCWRLRNNESRDWVNQHRRKEQLLLRTKGVKVTHANQVSGRRFWEVCDLYSLITHNTHIFCCTNWIVNFTRNMLDFKQHAWLKQTILMFYSLRLFRNMYKLSGFVSVRQARCLVIDNKIIELFYSHIASAPFLCSVISCKGQRNRLEKHLWSKKPSVAFWVTVRKKISIRFLLRLTYVA